MSDATMLDLSALRRTYARAALGEGDVADDPVAQFAAWFAEAQAAQVPEPNGMTLATATPDGRPSARVVLLKSVDARGFVFYTDYRSRKGAELDANPRAALAFWWEPLERQVRVAGRVERVSREESAACSPTARRSRPTSPPPKRASPTWRTFRSPSTGAATAWCRTRWSSGRGGRTGCTTESSTCAMATRGVGGGCRRDAALTPPRRRGPRAAA